MRILLPVLWAVVATAIGAFLYRYSTAKFETKWVMFTGAAAIAAGCFYGLYRATPRSLMERIRPGEVVVERPDIMRLRQIASEFPGLVAAAQSLCTENACNVRNNEDCLKAINALEKSTIGIGDLSRVLGEIP
jgi:hypothetical protein